MKTADGSPETFVLDRTENPHPRMLAAAVKAKAATLADPSSSAAFAYWQGYRDAMCDATGETPEAIEAWMDRASRGRG